MSRPAYNIKSTYIGAGNKLDYTFNFKIIDKSQLRVVQTLADDTLVYSVPGTDLVNLTNVVFNESGGTVYLNANLPTGNKLLIMFADDQPVQPQRFANAGEYTLRQIENALDRLTGPLQKLFYWFSRVPKISDNYIGDFDGTIPAPIAGYVPIFNDNANGYDLISRDAFKGDKGDQGDVTPILFDPIALSVDYDDDATVTNLGTPESPILQFTLRAGPQGPQGQSTVLVTNSDQLPNNAIGGEGDMWIVFNAALPENGNVYQKVAGVYNQTGNIIGPPGGVVSIDTETGPLTYTGTGFSSRFNQQFDYTSLRDALSKIIAYAYLGPQVSLTAAGNGTIREKGAAVTSVLLTAAVTKRSDPIAAVRFYKDGVLIHTIASPNPNGGNETYTWTGSFSDNTSFSVQVDDDGTTGGPTTATSTQNFTFVYPYYVGSGAQALSTANVALLTKLTIASTASLTRTINVGSGQVPYLAYPASYGALTSIKDVNNFEVLGAFTLRTENITGLDGNPVSYRIYEGLNPLTANAYQFTFIR